VRFENSTTPSCSSEGNAVQFHLDGFKSGDPELYPEASPPTPSDVVDVLIVGAGPTGLTLAAQLAAFPEIRTRVVEQKPGPLQLGQADGIACRTMEMFEAFGFAEKVLKEAYFVNEVSFWKPDAAEPGRIVRSSRVQDVEDGLSEFPHVILNQARVHDFYLERMRLSPTRLAPDYGLRLIGLEIPEAETSAPVIVRLQRNEGEVEPVKARFVVGCDGARSAVRAAIGRQLTGDSANQAWGVMDVLAVTDFPDVRLKTAIQSASEGSALIIPREGGYLFRIYIELNKLNENARVSSLNLTSERLIAAAQRILKPYTFEVKEVVWWSAYEIGQRLCDVFDDVADAARMPRVFIAGDACHTHSPKAGQGMNVSMQDSFNLGWKLAAVLRGVASPNILHTYSRERQTVARELIDFDREWAKMFSAPPKDPSRPDIEGVDPQEFQRYFVRQLRFTAGVETQYYPSIISGAASHQALAKGFSIGRRFHSAPVIRVADAKLMQLGHCVRADGRWRLFAFADTEDPSSAPSRLRALCDVLQRDANSPIVRHTPSGWDLDSVIDVRAVFQQGHRDVALETAPALLLPRKGRYGLIDYEKMFCPDLKGGQDIFELRGVDRQGAAVIVRPDQYVAHVLALDAFEEIAAFFAGFMRGR
jgi:2-polyprenyl-6-methoxyphenol hydroxylase-like FAD-dependent oxidoreductase